MVTQLLRAGMGWVARWQGLFADWHSQQEQAAPPGPCEHPMAHPQHNPLPPPLLVALSLLFSTKMDLSVQSRSLPAWLYLGCAYKRPSIDLTAKIPQIELMSWPQHLLCPIFLQQCCAPCPVLSTEATSLPSPAPSLALEK